MGNSQGSAFNGPLGTRRSLRFSRKMSQRESLHRSVSCADTPVRINASITESYDLQGDGALVPVSLATDQELLAELARRRVNVVHHLTQALVDQSYTLSTQPLGRGSSGDVYPATHRGSGRHVACKLIRRDAAMNDMKTMINEVEILKRVRHTNIVSAVEIFESSRCQWLMLELVSGSDLRGFIVSHRHARGTGTAAVLGAAGNGGNRSGNSTHSGGGVSERRATGISLQLLRAVQYLHSMGVVHRDIKSENILIQEPEVTVKLTDFGLSALCGTDCDGGFDSQDGVRRKKFRGLLDPWGTRECMAPEVLVGNGYGPQCDMWAVGCALFELLDGAAPFQHRSAANRDDIEDCIMRGAYPRQRLSGLSIHAQSLLEGLLRVDPVRRVGPSEALSCVWLSGRPPDQPGELGAESEDDMVHTYSSL